jgi:uncharacterized membrane protein YqhA|tara:strand:+ start:450 stop:653 length:204 start_codon:yes stop_codon:yes gene_type:complete
MLEKEKEKKLIMTKKNGFLSKVEAFMDLGTHTDRDLRWQVIIHLVFIASGLLLAAMDYITANTKNKY